MSNTNQPISQDVEITAVALLARGDTHKSIASELGISEGTVSAIRDRNQDNLELIKGELIIHKTKQAKRLLDKSHNLIEKKLENIDKYEDERLNLQDELDAGLIEYSEYNRRLRKIPTITLSELTALSKEMFNQSQIEEGKPTSIGSGVGATSTDAAKKLEELIEALHSNNEVKMLELMSGD